MDTDYSALDIHWLSEIFYFFHNSFFYRPLHRLPLSKNEMRAFNCDGKRSCDIRITMCQFAEKTRLMNVSSKQCYYYTILMLSLVVAKKIVAYGKKKRFLFRMPCAVFQTKNYFIFSFKSQHSEISRRDKRKS